MKTEFKRATSTSDPDTDRNVSDTERTEFQKEDNEHESLLGGNRFQDNEEPVDEHEKDASEETDNDTEERGDDAEKGDNSDKDKGGEDDESLLKAPDGGYGWLVVFGMFLNQMIYGGLNRSAGIFFLQFKSKYDTSAQVAAWPWALMTTVTFLMGPGCGAFTNRYSVRTAYMIGTLIATICFIADGFAPNIYVLFVTHTLLGIGRGLQSPLLIVNLYFDKHRSRAVGIGSAGVGVGSFWMAPLCQFLFDFYGFQGAFLVVGAMALNGLVCAMLFRPLSMYHRFVSIKRMRNKKSQTMEEGKAEINCKSKADHKNGIGDIELTNTKTPKQNGVDNIERRPSTKSKSSSNRQKPDNFIKASLKICFPVEHKEKGQEKKKQMFHWHLLKDIPLLMFCFGTLFFMVTFKSAFTFLPAIALDNGLSDYESALVLTVFGAMDTFGRIGVGFVMDTDRLRRFRPYFFQVFLLVTAGASLLIPSLTSFISFCFVCAIYGFMTGAFISQRMVVITDITGREYMSSSLGIQKSFQAIGSLVGPPISGAMRDELGSYDTSFYLGGASMLGSVLLYSLCIFFQIRRKKRNQ